MTMSKRPLYDNILVKVDPISTMTASGVILVSIERDSSLKGTVVAVGHGIKLKSGELRPLTVKEGDKVLFKKDIGTKMKVDGEELLLMRENDLFGVIDND